MLLDQLLASATSAEAIDIPLGWGQGRAVFGGLVGALMIARAQALLADDTKVLKSASINFVGPVLGGEQASLNAQVLRAGKSVTTVQVQLIQQGQVQSVLTASFGTARESIIQIDSQIPLISLKPREELNPMPYLEGIVPEFLKHFNVYWSEGSLPFSASKQPDFAGWMRFKPATQVASVQLPHLFALVDLWPPSVLPLFNRPAPASSLSWQLDLVNLPAQISGDAWWRYQVKTDYAADGYAFAQAHIWDEQGQLVAISRQTVTVFL